MTAIMSQPWELIDELPPDYDEIIESYEPEPDEVEVKRSWQPPPPWMDFGACVGSDAEAWFPDIGQPATRARKICWTRCPVQLLCLSHAIEHDEEGIWGGLNQDQRRMLAGRTPRGKSVLRDDVREELTRRGWEAIA